MDLPILAYTHGLSECMLSQSMYDLPEPGLSPSPRGSPPLTGYAASIYMILPRSLS